LSRWDGDTVETVTTEGLVVLAADHRARGVVTLERYADYLEALRRSLPYCDGILASTQPLGDLVAAKDVGPDQQTFLSVNRTGLHGSVFELDDRLVAPVELAARAGYTGVKHMTRIDLRDPATAGALELLGEVLAEADRLGLQALIEPLSWKDGAIDRSTDAVVYAAVVANDLGAPLIKVPVPGGVTAGAARVEAVRRVVESVGVPVLFLGGPRGSSRRDLLNEVADAMAGGARGLAIGRAVYQDPDPARMAEAVAGLVKARWSLEEAAAFAGGP
jgi:DhnA family fructose-bisphosphate aldolase class Ia